MKGGTYNLFVGDCLERLRRMPDASVDLIVTSPPYESARTYGIGFALSGQAWVDWAVERFIECYRVSRGAVVWVVEGQTRDYQWSATPALMMADLHRRGVKLRKPPAYSRVGIPGSGGPDWFRNDYEFCVCATHGRLPWSDNTAMGHAPKWGPGGEMSNRLGDGTRVNQWGAHRSGAATRKRNGVRQPPGRPSHEYVVAGEAKTPGVVKVVKANPGNLIRCNVGGNQMGHKLAHENEAPFPEKVPEFFIRSCCPPGGTVLDPFCGSGTTILAALKHGRNAIGIDIRQNQIDITTRRIRDVFKETTQ